MKCIDCELEKETKKCEICNREVCKECSDDNDKKHRIPMNGDYNINGRMFTINNEYRTMCNYCAVEYYKFV